MSCFYQTIRSEHGQTVALPCRLTSRDPVLVVEWSRTDLGSDYVLLFRDEQIDPFNQHPSYQNRVGMKDLENRDVSLVLVDGTTDDNGTYECRVVQTGKNRRKQLISSVHLVVAPPPPSGEKKKNQSRTVPGLIVSLFLFSLVVSAFISLTLWKKKRPETHRPVI
uniref:Ig-like domain-containing protein n=1 Tax=Xiphophorus couchianus TaxID=32473 RepID=A0A3B5KSP3_9TELE